MLCYVMLCLYVYIYINKYKVVNNDYIGTHVL